MAKTKLTVVTEFGTFTRTTARDYKFLVIVKDVRFEVLEASRVAGIKNAEQQIAKMTRAIETRQCQDARGPVGDIAGDWDRKCHEGNLADGSYTKWINDYKKSIADNQTPITKDVVDPWGAWAWTSRLDLARKEASTSRVSRYRHVVIIDVATGKEVR